MSHVRSLLVVPCLLALTSCQVIVPLIFVNDSSTDVTIRYVEYRWEISPGVLPKCRFDSYTPRVAPGVVSGRSWKDGDWGVDELGHYNHDSCEAEIVVKSHHSLWFELNGACTCDEACRPDDPVAKTALEPFVITSPAGTIELHAADVSRAFKNRWGGACILNVSEVMKSARPG